MALRLDDKKKIVAEAKQLAETALSVVASHNLGLTVHEMTDLRHEGRKLGVSVRVVRNTLAGRAFEATAFECMKPILVGPTILAFSQKEHSSAARLLRDFCKKHENIRVTGLSVSGRFLSATELDFLAQLPTRNEAIAQMLSVMRAPVTQFVRTLSEPHAQFVRVLSAIGDKK